MICSKHRVARFRPGLCTAVLVGLLAAPVAHAQNLIVNGSFESGTDPGGFTTPGPGSTAIDGWSIDSGTIDYVGTLWEGSQGFRSLDMSGTGGTKGVISQVIATEIGVQYRLDFDLAGNYGGAPAVKQIAVLAIPSGAGGGGIYSFDATGRSANDMGWVTHTLLFTATNTSTAIVIGANDDTGFGAALDNVRVTERPPGSPALEILDVHQFFGIYNDSGSGADRDGAFHRPMLPPGWFVLSHQGQGHHGLPGEPEPGGSMVVARPIEPDALAAPVAFQWIWQDSGSGASNDGAAWRPVPPAGYTCLGDFVTSGSQAYTDPLLSANPFTQESVARFRCVRDNLLAAGRVGARIWDDKGSGGDYDFSAWRVGAADDEDVAVGGFVGSNLYDAPTDPVYVLAAAAVEQAQPPALADGPYLELEMLRDLVAVAGGGTQCEWYPQIYNDDDSGATFGNVGFWHPRNIPPGFHQLGHTYEKNWYPNCARDILFVAKELVPGSLAAPVGWELIWTDQGSGGEYNGAVWKPIPPPGYRCLGTFITGGYGYAPPDHPFYVQSPHPINDAVVEAGQNFRCVHKDLLAPGRVSVQGWNDKDSGASLNVAIWEVDPAVPLGPGFGVDVGQFVATGYHGMPGEPVYVVDSRAVDQTTGQLTQQQLDALLDKGPKLRLHPDEVYYPDDPAYTLNTQTSLCSAQVPNPYDFGALGASDSYGELCSAGVDITLGFIPTDVYWNGCSPSQPNPGTGHFFAGGGATPQCAPTSAAGLFSQVHALENSPEASDPDWKYWLDVDVPIGGGFGLPTQAGDPDRAKVVVRVKPWNFSGHEVQYWVWYPYNGPGRFEAGCGSLDATKDVQTVGRHFGDWEVIALRYDDDDELAEIYLSRHSDEEVFSVKPNGSTLQGPIDSDGLQPILYSAKNSHAHYRLPAEWTYAEPISTNVLVCTAYLRLKDRTGNGYELDLADRSRLILGSSEYTSIATDPAPWLEFLGRWGRYEAVGFQVAFNVDGSVYGGGFDDVGAGPTGPNQKPLWGVTTLPEPSGGTFWGATLLAWLARRRRRARLPCRSRARPRIGGGHTPASTSRSIRP